VCRSIRVELFANGNHTATKEGQALATTTDKRGGKFTGREIEGATLEARQTGKDVWLTDAGSRGEGRFTCRCTPAGARIFAYRYTGAGGTRDVLRIASYDPKAQDGLTLDEARRKAGEWARLYQTGVANLRQHFEEEAEAATAAKIAQEQAKQAAHRKAKRGSLRALMDAYTDTLAGRQAQADAIGIFKLHVKDAFPDLAARPAAAVTAEQLRDALARLIGDGKGRTAAKLRAYLRAAYSLALRAGLDPTVPEALTAFDVQHNPLERLPSLSQFSRALDRALTLPELVAFWRRAQALPQSPANDALRACVLLGGQRPAQVVRLAARDVDADGRTLTLFDVKGRNRAANPRRHVLPIPDALLPMLERRKAQCESPDALIFAGTTKETLSAIGADLCRAMRDAKELQQGSFQLRDLRRSAETHLAAMGVSTDVRAQLQSHGLGGIQARHYDKHGYMAEKRAALEQWAQRLTETPPGKVVAIKRGGKAAA